MAELVQLNPEQAIQLGAQSLVQFGHIFLPKTFRSSSPEIHDNIGALLYSNARYIGLELFRDAAKTTLLRAFTLQRICYGLSNLIQFIGLSQPHSIHSIRWLKRQIEFNPLLIPFGLRKGAKWMDEWIEIEHTVENKIIVVMALGITGQVRGFNPDDYRPDLQVLDDVLNEENTSSKVQRDKTEELIFGAIINSLAPATDAPHAKAIFAQSPLHREDAMQKCKSNPEWAVFSAGILDASGESTWPARYPTDSVLKAKQAAILAGQYRLWMREKECQLVTAEQKAIDINQIRYYDHVPVGGTRIIAIDPASSDTKRADKNVVMCVLFLGLDVYILDYHASSATMPDQCAQKFFEQAMEFRPITRGGVESISYQRVLKWFLEREMEKRRIFIPLLAVQDQRRKADRIMQHIPGLVAYGHLYIRPHMTDFITQADDYDPEIREQPDDILDALAISIMTYDPHYVAIEGEFSVLADESLPALPETALAGCP